MGIVSHVVLPRRCHPAVGGEWVFDGGVVPSGTFAAAAATAAAATAAAAATMVPERWAVAVTAAGRAAGGGRAAGVAAGSPPGRGRPVRAAGVRVRVWAANRSNWKRR